MTWLAVAVMCTALAAFTVAVLADQQRTRARRRADDLADAAAVAEAERTVYLRWRADAPRRRGQFRRQEIR